MNCGDPRSKQVVSQLQLDFAHLGAVTTNSEMRYKGVNVNVGLDGDGEWEGAVQVGVETMGAASDREGSMQDEGSDEAGRWRVLLLGNAASAPAHQQRPGATTLPRHTAYVKHAKHLSIVLTCARLTCRTRAAFL